MGSRNYNGTNNHGESSSSSTMVNAVKLTYPNAVFCSISLKGEPINNQQSAAEAGGGRSKYEISRACTEALSMPIPSMYDFSLEKSILQKAQQQKQKGIEKMSLRKFQSVSSSLGEGDRSSSPTPPYGGIETSFSNMKLTSSLSKDQRNKLSQLKAIINADDSVCLALLEEHQFDVERATNAFFSC